MSLNLPPKVNGIYHHKPDCECDLCSHPRQYNYVKLRGGACERQEQASKQRNTHQR